MATYKKRGYKPKNKKDENLIDESKYKWTWRGLETGWMNSTTTRHNVHELDEAETNRLEVKFPLIPVNLNDVPIDDLSLKFDYGAFALLNDYMILPVNTMKNAFRCFPMLSMLCDALRCFAMLYELELQGTGAPGNWSSGEL